MVHASCHIQININSQKVFSYIGSARTTATDTTSIRYILLIFSLYLAPTIVFTEKKQTPARRQAGLSVITYLIITFTK